MKLVLKSGLLAAEMQTQEDKCTLSEDCCHIPCESAQEFIHMQICILTPKTWCVCVWLCVRAFDNFVCKCT